MVVNGQKPSKILANLEVLDVPGLAPAIAPVRSASNLLVHIYAQVPEVLEAVVHRYPLRGLALACQNRKQIVSTPPRNIRLDRE